MGTFKKVTATLSGLALMFTALLVPAAAADEVAPTTVAHWRFQNETGYYTGSVDDDNITIIDLTGNGNNLVTATVGNGDQLDIFSWDDGCDIPTAKGSTALKMDNTKAKAATVDPYTAEETSYTGGYTSGKYLETVEDAPMNAMTFENGFSFEIVYKLSSELDNNYNRYTGLFSRQGVVESGNEPPFSIALAEWNNDANGTLGANGTWMQYVHLDADEMKTNNEFDSVMMYGGDWHHILVTSDGTLTELFVDGEDLAMVGEAASIFVTDPTFSWEVGVGRKLGEGHENDSKNVNSPEGMIRRLFAGAISEIRVTDGYMNLEDSLFFKSASIEYAPVEAPAEEPAAPAYTYPGSGTDGDIIAGTVIGNETGWGDNANAGRAAAFDGNPETFFDPLGVGDGYCGMDAGEPYILDKVAILSRGFDADWNARFKGAEIRGGNEDDPSTAVTLWKSDTAGTYPDYYIITEFENNTGYRYFFYYNTEEHGDVAEVEFYGHPGQEEAAEETVEEPVESKGFADVTAAAAGKNVITGYTFVEGSNGFGGEGPEMLFDGETSTKFCTAELPAEAVVELDGVYTITGFTMATANDNADYNGRSPNAWTISVSADGENWTEFAKGDDSFFEETNFTYYVGEGTAEGVSYVKFNAEGTASGTFQVSELTLFGDKAAETVDTELTEKEEAPQTFDIGIIAAVVSVISLAGFAVAKKH